MHDVVSVRYCLQPPVANASNVHDARAKERSPAVEVVALSGRSGIVTLPCALLVSLCECLR